MSLFRATGQFDDADDDSAAVAAEQNIAQATAASRFSAASRAVAMGFAPGAALARAAAERSANSGAAASYLSMLQNAAAADPNSPYFQRQAYRQTFMNTQSPYGGLPSAEASLAYARHTGAYPYGAAPGPSPETGVQGYPGTHSYSSPHAASLASFYQRQAQDLSSASLLDRAYQLQENSKQINPGQAGSNTSLQFLSKGQSTAKRSPSSGGVVSPRTGRGGRGGSGGGRGGRGGGRGRVGRGGRGPSRSSPAKNAVVQGEPKGEHPEIDASGQRWYSGCVPLGLPEDKYWLSEPTGYICDRTLLKLSERLKRTLQHLCTDETSQLLWGKSVYVVCTAATDPPSERGQQATSYPSLISGIYNSVQQMLRLHYDCCMSLPADIRAES